jgi:Zn-finger nucleic acid-binding protein
VTGYRVVVTCPRCDGELDHHQSRIHAGTEAVAVARCPACRRTFMLAVQLREVAEPERVAAAANHRRRRLAAV